MRTIQGEKGAILFVAAMLVAASAAAQDDDFASVQIVPHDIKGKVHYLEGRGGNIGLLIGDDGVVMVDDQFAPLSEKIVAAIRSMTDKDIRFLINSHVHPDHMGGNANFAALGVPIVAHDNVRNRMVQGIRGDAPEPVAAWPIITYGDNMKLHIDGEEVEVIKAPPAHTDGDSFIYFKTSNVMHMGDVFRTGAFPVIDTANGGTAAGTIAALRLALDRAEPDTAMLPGHGQVSTPADVQKFLDMVVDVEARVSALVDQDMTLEQVIAATPTAAYDDLGFGSPDRFITGVYESLKSE
jgi:glyoxylase-like metal-dependent hydrolase (beta-lactamase superfamily II)